MPAQDYETVVLVYLGDANVRNLSRDRTTLFLNLTPGEALAVVLNRLRVVRLLSESDLLTEDGVLLFRYHLLYWQPFVQRLLTDMYSRYSMEPARYIYHPWFEDLPWVYERCGLPAKVPVVSRGFQCAGSLAGLHAGFGLVRRFTLLRFRYLRTSRSRRGLRLRVVDRAGSDRPGLAQRIEAR